MEDHRCKICFRLFVNGKALGGHMRSHTMNSRPFSSSSSEEEDEEKSGLLSSLISVHQDRESSHETDSSKKHPVCTRSEMVGKSRISTLNWNEMDGFCVEDEKVKTDEYCFSPFLDPESSSSSLSDVTHEEDAAHCLIMLSRDKRRRDEMEGEEKKSEGDDYSKDSCEEKVKKNKARAKYYRCEICSKLFRSFQALGGHRASHNKMRVNTRDSGGGSKAATAVLERTVACPFCPKVFTSGQAFGGHKRTHFIAKTIAKPFSRNSKRFDIDLNFPASFED